MFGVSMRALFSPSLPCLSLPSLSLLHLPKPSLFSNLRRLSLANSVFAVHSSPTNSPLSAVSRRQSQTDAAAMSVISHTLPFSSSGEIHVVVGPMFSGKTTTLLRRMLAARETGKNIVIIKSDKDTRYCVESIVTHDGDKFPCWSLPDLSSSTGDKFHRLFFIICKERFGLDAYENQLDVIGIDEAQFFGDLYEFCREAADKDGKTVIVAGLDGDYLRRRFGSVLDVIPIAETVTKLTSRCEVCGKRASFTMRKTEETETELIGGAEVYMPVCRTHYVSGQGVLETARAVLDSSHKPLHDVVTN